MKISTKSRSLPHWKNRMMWKKKLMLIISKNIYRLIDELPPRRREIFNLSRKEQKSYKEIAILLNISEKTVENQISEALKYLKKNITLLLLFI